MKLFLQSIDYKHWEIIKDRPTIPMKVLGDIHTPKERHEWSDQERKHVQLNSKAIHFLLCALGPEEYAKVSSCDHAKEI